MHLPPVRAHVGRDGGNWGRWQVNQKEKGREAEEESLVGGVKMNMERKKQNVERGAGNQPNQHKQKGGRRRKKKKRERESSKRGQFTVRAIKMRNLTKKMTNYFPP